MSTPLEPHGVHGSPGSITSPTSNSIRQGNTAQSPLGLTSPAFLIDSLTAQVPLVEVLIKSPNPSAVTQTRGGLTAPVQSVEATLLMPHTFLPI